jgi:hypothetical protein
MRSATGIETSDSTEQRKTSECQAQAHVYNPLTPTLPYLGPVTTTRYYRPCVRLLETILFLDQITYRKIP